ncbi:hypothetical protein P12x_005039 [Tundrisphaera lichenicola]|uniref:hypothetical protein n=1 Tax=Tundrisphaera lichenicola TaxID=2029860 RepID=UPI003EB88123
MNRLVRFSLALLGLSLVAPLGAYAQDASAGYRPLAGKPSTAAPHKHRGRTLCAKCAAAAEKVGMMPPGKIVACAHSKNGVCTACAAALALPGPVVMMGSPSAVEEPGRAVASSGPAAGAPMMAGRGTSEAPFDGEMGGPSPIGVVQANFSQGAPTGMPAASMVPTASSMMPGHAIAEAGAGPAPFQHRTTSSSNPRILGHLFGWSGIGSERAEARRQRKVESHAMIHYDNAGSTVNEVPASAVYGR